MCISLKFGETLGLITLLHYHTYNKETDRTVPFVLFFQPCNIAKFSITKNVATFLLLWLTLLHMYAKIKLSQIASK